MKIAVLGAERTGKTQLVSELNHALAAQIDMAIADNPTPRAVWQYDVTLLMGWDGSGPCATDQQVRQLLDTFKISYATVYGTGPRRLACALEIIQHHQCNGTQEIAINNPSRWQWACEKCSDADCEHQLFSSLINERSMQV
jgi:hypothetical protein